MRVAKSSPGRVTRVVYRAASRSYREGNFFSSTNAYADGEEIEFIRNTRPWECTVVRLQNSSTKFFGETIDLFGKCLIGVSSWDWFFVASATERWGLFFEDI